jgi:hypothetical protein
MQTRVVKRLTENVNSQRNIQWSSENLHVLEDFFCALHHKVQVLEETMHFCHVNFDTIA